MAGERRGRGEEREQAGGWLRYPGGTPAELEATRGGGRCGGCGKGGRESAPADGVSGQCGKRTAGGAVGRRHVDEGAAGGSAGNERVREDSRAPHVCGLTGGSPAQTRFGRSASRVRLIRRVTG